MGTVTLNKNNRLFWLGRYSERVYQGVRSVRAMQDSMLDGGILDTADLCRRLGIDAQFESGEEFCRRYLFDITLDDSIACAADAMLGNGMVLRETLGTPTLSYLQMAVTAMDLAAKSIASGVELQWVLDDIMAFRGSCEDQIDDEPIRNVIKCGASVERLSTQLRFDEKEDIVRREARKLLNRLYKTHLDRDEDRLRLLSAYALQGAEQPDYAALLDSVEHLFRV